MDTTDYLLSGSLHGWCVWPPAVLEPRDPRPVLSALALSLPACWVSRKRDPLQGAYCEFRNKWNAVSDYLSWLHFLTKVKPCLIDSVSLFLSLQDSALPGVCVLPDDHFEGFGEASGLAENLHYLYPQWDYRKPGQCHLLTVQSRGTGVWIMGLKLLTFSYEIISSRVLAVKSNLHIISYFLHWLLLLSNFPKDFNTAYTFLKNGCLN